MTKRNLFTHALFLFILIAFSAISQCLSALSNKRLCYDPDCSVPISRARTVIKYPASIPGTLSFGNNAKVTVYSKEAGDNPELWGVEINGKHGYVPKRFLKEYQILQKDLQHEVPTDQSPSNSNVSDETHQPKTDDDKPKLDINGIEISNAQISNLNMSTEELPHNVSNVTLPYEIVNGTTLYSNSSQSSTQLNNVVETTNTTEVPNKQDTVKEEAVRSSNNEKINKSAIFTNDDNLPHKTVQSETKNKEQNISQNINIEDVKDSEKILNSTEITGINDLSLIANDSLKNDNANELGQTLNNTKNDTLVPVEQIHSSDKFNVIEESGNSSSFATTANVTIEGKKEKGKSSEEPNTNDAQVLENGYQLGEKENTSKEKVTKQVLQSVDTAGINDSSLNASGSPKNDIVSESVQTLNDAKNNTTVEQIHSSSKLNGTEENVSNISKEEKLTENGSSSPLAAAANVTIEGNKEKEKRSGQPNAIGAQVLENGTQLGAKEHTSKEKVPEQILQSVNPAGINDSSLNASGSPKNDIVSESVQTLNDAKNNTTVEQIQSSSKLNGTEENVSNISKEEKLTENGSSSPLATAANVSIEGNKEKEKRSGEPNVIGAQVLENGTQFGAKENTSKEKVLEQILQSVDTAGINDSSLNASGSPKNDIVSESVQTLNDAKNNTTVEQIQSSSKLNGTEENVSNISKEEKLTENGSSSPLATAANVSIEGNKEKEKRSGEPNVIGAQVLENGTQFGAKENTSKEKVLEQILQSVDTAGINDSSLNASGSPKNDVNELGQTSNATKNVTPVPVEQIQSSDKFNVTEESGNSSSFATTANVTIEGKKEKGKSSEEPNTNDAQVLDNGYRLGGKENTSKEKVTEQVLQSVDTAGINDSSLNANGSPKNDNINELSPTLNDTKNYGGSNEGFENNAMQNVQYETTVADTSKDTNMNGSDDSHFAEVLPTTLNENHFPTVKESNLESEQLLHSTRKNMISENILSINEFRNRNLLNAGTTDQYETESVVKDKVDHVKDETLYESKDDISIGDKSESFNEPILESTVQEIQAVSSSDMCAADNVECSSEDNTQNNFARYKQSQNDDSAIMQGIKVENSYWLTLMYLSVTATATLMFSLGYYYIENMRRDGRLIAKINKLEKDLLVSSKECTILNENLKLTKDKLTSIEDESFGSNEMVLSLKADLEALQTSKAELEEQVTSLEKDLEGATEAGLELERMLREVLSTNNEVNPLAQSVEDLQARLNVQQAANESLTNALNVKSQENEALSAEFSLLKKKYKELEVELTQATKDWKFEMNNKNSIQKTLSGKIQQLEMQIKEISTIKVNLQKELKAKEVEIKDLQEVISQLNSNNLDLDKLYDVSRIKAETTALLEERNELKVRLAEIEGAHSLLEEHMKVVKDEMVTLSEQCKVAEKEKKDAETRLEVLSHFFEEKEAQRQKEEAIWLQQQGEVVSTVERIQTMQNEMQNYKQQIEMLKREILDQEREYKNQISVLETKAHEQWVVARQVERRLEESKVEAGQLRNRLTLIEKNINDADSEAKSHRLEANGETATSPPLFIGAESSSSPIMFSGSSSVPPPPPPSYLHSLFPPYLPPPLPNASGVPPYEVSQRPPPLGGRLSSPPPMPLHPPASSRYDNAGSPPPMSPHLLPPFDHRSLPPPFASDHIHPLPPPPPGSIFTPPLGTTHSWGEESLPPPRSSGFRPSQRERVRNHKGSLHSSGDSLDKTHHSSKV